MVIQPWTSTYLPDEYLSFWDIRESPLVVRILPLRFGEITINLVEKSGQFQIQSQGRRRL